MSHRPNCSDWEYCPCCEKYYCSKYDKATSEELCGKCYRNRDYEREEKIIFTIEKEECVQRDIFDKCDKCYKSSDKDCYIPFPEKELNSRHPERGLYEN
jgi:hypothetical protein